MYTIQIVHFKIIILPIKVHTRDTSILKSPLTPFYPYFRSTHDLSNCQLIKYRSGREQNQYCQLVYETGQKYERPIKNKSNGRQRWIAQPLKYRSGSGLTQSVTLCFRGEERDDSQRQPASQSSVQKCIKTSARDFRNIF